MKNIQIKNISLFDKKRNIIKQHNLKHNRNKIIQAIKLNIKLENSIKMWNNKLRLHLLII